MSFLEVYKEGIKEVSGIPGRKMNQPVAAKNLLGDIGLELEIEANNLPAPATFDFLIGPETGARWLGKADGSLRGEAIEYVLDRPCNAGEVPTLVLGLYDAMQKSGIRFNLSNRCSTHVHRNVGGKRLDELTTVITLWTIFEECLINWCGDERKVNHFCLPSSEQTVVTDWWDKYLQGRSDPLDEGQMKYSGLNIVTMSTLGSFEFRVMRASEDPQPIIDWALFVDALFDYASANPNPSLLSSGVSEKGGRELFKEVCKNLHPRFTESVLDHPDNTAFDRMCLDGFRRTQKIVLGYPWSVWQPMIHEEYIPNPFASKGSSFTRVDPGIRIRRGDPLRGLDRFIVPEPVEVPQQHDFDVILRGDDVDYNLPIEFTTGDAARLYISPRQGQNRLYCVVSENNELIINGINVGDPYWYRQDGTFEGSEDFDVTPRIRNRVPAQGVVRTMAEMQIENARLERNEDADEDFG